MNIVCDSSVFHKTNIPLVYLLLVILCLHFTWNKASGKDVDIVRSLKDIHYDPSERPFAEVKPITIKIQNFLKSIGPINEKDFTFEASLNVRKWWFDPRLKYLNLTRKLALRDLNLVWTPYISVRESVEVRRMKPRYQRVVIHTDGNVHSSMEMTIVSRCAMNLHFYPMDNQICHLVLESFAFGKTDLVLEWFDSPIKLKEGYLSIEGYKLVGVKTSTYMEHHKISNSSEEFVDLVSTFLIQRHLTFHIFRTFVPSMLLIGTSIGSLWVPDNAIPARMTIIVTCFLVNMFILQSVSEVIIQVDYVIPMQIFLLVNISTITLLLIEFLTILRLRARDEMKYQTFLSHKNNTLSLDIPLDTLNRATHSQKGRDTEENIYEEVKEEEEEEQEDDNDDDLLIQQIATHRLDEICRIVFPAFYSLFIITFFCYYIVHQNEEEESL